MTDRPHIKFADVAITFQPGSPILEHVCFELAHGEHVVLTGPSGGGKSSLLRAVFGATHGVTGSITVGDHPVQPAFIAAVRRGLSYIGQTPSFTAPSVREALLRPFTFRAHRARTPDMSKVAQLLDAVMLPQGILTKAPQQLSGGERQRIAIVRALLLERPLILADEVTSALDQVSKTRVIAHLQSTDATIFSVSHDPDWIAAADRVLVVDQTVRGGA